MSYSSNVHALAEAWISYESNCKFEVSDSVVQSLDDTLINQAAIKIGEPEELKGDAWHDQFTQIEVDSVKKMFAKFRDDKAIFSLLDQAVKHSMIELPSIFSDRILRCVGSFQVGVRNFVRFVDDKESFYLIQHHRFFRAIYFPLRRMVICVDESPLGPEVAAGLDREILRLLPKLAAEHKVREARFAGLSVSYPRPYHFFYDLLPVVFKWFSDRPDILHNLPSIIQLTDGDFLPAKEFFSFQGDQYSFVNFQELNDYFVERRQFLLHPGYAERKVNSLDSLDQALRGYALRRSEAGKILAAKRKHGDIAIWVGVCAEKRSWLQAKLALHKLVARLAASSNSVKLIVDGLTATSSNSFVGSYESELSLLKEVERSMPTNVETISLIGAAATDKIAVAQGVDLFLTSFLTDSMWVARFGKKTGVAHGANVAAYFDHLHPNTFFVPKAYITDSPAKANENWAKVSYSIDPDFVVDYCMEVIKLPFSGEVTINILSDSGGRVGIEASGSDKFFKTNARYCSVNDASVNFNRRGDTPHTVSSGALYQFYLDDIGEAAGGDLSLVVISHAKGKRLTTDFIRLGTHKDIVFPNEAETFRLFFRLSGYGKYKLPRIRLISIPSPSQLPVTVRRNLTKWGRDIYRYNDCREFVESIEVGLQCGIHAVNYHGVFLEFNFYDQGFSDLLVFFNAAVTRTSNTELPVFSGAKAIGLKANILMVSDPCLYLDNSLSLAWYVGARNLPLQKDLSIVLSGLSARYGKNNTIFYGGSGGGFASLYYASKVDGATAICCNPQTSVSNYDKASVERFMSVCFEPLNAEFANKYLSDSGFTALLGANEFNTTARVIYLQNKNDAHHLEKHFQPYLARIGFGKCYQSNKNVQILNEKLALITSSKWGDGHAAAPKEIVYGMLQALLKDDAFLKNNESDAEEFFSDQEISAYQYIRSCSLAVINGRLVASAAVDTDQLNGQPFMAWYLYHDGLRVVTTKYADDLTFEFDYAVGNGVYWVIGFLKCKLVKQNLRSRKLSILSGGDDV